MNWIVLGVEGDFAGTSIKGTAPCVVVFTCSTSDNWVSTITGRVGGVVLDRILPYIKGGVAWENTQYTGTDPLGVILPAPGNSISATQTNMGAVLGMGVEYAFTRNWSGFVEYDYIDFGTHNVNFAGFGGTGTGSFRDTLSVVKGGVNFKFF